MFNNFFLTGESINDVFSPAELRKFIEDEANSQMRIVMQSLV